MGRRKNITGQCKICGKHGKLSFEHVPPEAAFNNQKAFYLSELNKINGIESKFINSDFDQLYSDRIVTKQQGGMGFYSLCETCNNNTGSWYGQAFVEWAKQSMSVVLKSSGFPSLWYPTTFFPLRVMKQILTMFFSINYNDFHEREPELVHFILNRHSNQFPKHLRLFCYYNTTGNSRYIGENFMSKGSSFFHISEISFPPIGFVLTINSPSPDNRLTEITHFSKYTYDDIIDHYQRFKSLPTYLPIPADYRTKKEIEQDVINSSSTQTKITPQ
jgi:hypothetical protein